MSLNAKTTAAAQQAAKVKQSAPPALDPLFPFRRIPFDPFFFKVTAVRPPDPFFDKRGRRE